MRALIVALGLTFAGCSSSSAESTGDVHTPSAAAQTAKTAPSTKTADAEHIETAYFAGGCFWGVEHYLEQMDGVLSVESGYMGGHLDNPTYKDVSYKETGHLETVRVRFDTERIDFEAVAKRFFEIHDPTQADGQGPDLGSQYLSAVFYDGPEQKKITEKLIGLLKDRGYDVVTDVREAGEFYIAEDYHQDYYAKTGKTPYCHSRVKRFGD